VSRIRVERRRRKNHFGEVLKESFVMLSIFWFGDVIDNLEALDVSLRMREYISCQTVQFVSELFLPVA
jgi:hypothetical protein